MSIDEESSPSKATKVYRSSSWRSLKERRHHPISSRTLSVDQLHRNKKLYQKSHSSRQISRSPIVCLNACHRKLSEGNSTNSHIRFDRLASNLISYSDPQRRHSQENLPRKSQRRTYTDQPLVASTYSTVSRQNTNSGGGDSGYSEESFATKSCQRPLHTSCPHCHCEQRSSFINYRKSRTDSSAESSPSDIQRNPPLRFATTNDEQRLDARENILISRSYPHIRSLPKAAIVQSQPPAHRTLAERRRRNLSCDNSLWTRTQTQRPVALRSSPLSSVFNHPGRTVIKTPCQSLNPRTANASIFGELNLAAIEHDSLHRSSSSSSFSSTSVTHKNPSQKKRRLFLVWHHYENSSLLSKSNGTKMFAVRRGDQVRLLKRIGKSTLLVQKEDDGTIGFLPQTCLAQHQINSFLSLKGLRETVL